jgi:hypothetical protein
MADMARTPEINLDIGQAASALVCEETVVGRPRDALPKRGAGGEVTYDLLTNELLLDGT